LHITIFFYLQNQFNQNQFIMKKTIFYFLTVIVTVSMLLNSCNKDVDNPSEITATGIDTQGDAIVTVKAMMTCVNGADFVYEEVASAKFENGCFKISFPKSVDNKYLSPLDIEGASNPDAKMGSVILYAFDAANNKIGTFSYENNQNDTVTRVFYAYINAKCKIKSKQESGNQVIEYDVSLAKGWNILYYVETTERSAKKGALTTQKPKGVTLRWVYQSSNHVDGNSFVNFKKEISGNDCRGFVIIKGTEYYPWSCGVEPAESGYKEVASGKYGIWHVDGNLTNYYDFDYSFENNTSYSVIYGETGVRVEVDAPGKTGFKLALFK